MIRPGATIGILGGGQLGRMLALSARSLGYRVHVLDPDSGCPASPVADRVFAARFDDVLAASELARSSDVVTVEIERIARACLDEAARHCPTRPGADVLARAQDRRLEKAWLNENGFETAPFRIVTSLEELQAAYRALGPSVAKTAREGYDGKGQVRLRSYDECSQAWTTLGGHPLVVEAWLTLDVELSVLVARRPSGEVRSYPAALNHHEQQILDWSVIPAPLDVATLRRADDIARDIAAQMGLEGLLAIEFFRLADGRLLVNEMAPRPHNSGHAATEACLTSQFEQLVRAVCDLPLGSTDVVRPTAIANLLGDLWNEGPPPFERALEMPGVRLHLYGKETARPGRKMGHLSASAATVEEAIRLAREARRRVSGSSA
jgi:5-(carboxyamino)imidazole ribonucleotide synthase